MTGLKIDRAGSIDVGTLSRSGAVEIRYRLKAIESEAAFAVTFLSAPFLASLLDMRCQDAGPTGRDG
jgi:hypothetical protein